MHKNLKNGAAATLLKDHLGSAFELGYTNAVKALRQMTNDLIQYNNFHHQFHDLDSEFFNKPVSFSRNGGSCLITTEIFGDISGKSYLFLNDREFEFLTGNLLSSKIKHEFVKELDNILSASVITHLSNQLKLKMYGDIPVHLGKVSGKMEEFIFNDFQESSKRVYVNSIFFTFEKQPAITPFFIWVIDGRVEKMLKETVIDIVK